MESKRDFVDETHKGQMLLPMSGFLLQQFWSTKICLSEYNKIMETKDHSHGRTDQSGWQEYI